MFVLHTFIHPVSCESEIVHTTLSNNWIWAYSLSLTSFVKMCFDLKKINDNSEMKILLYIN